MVYHCHRKAPLYPKKEEPNFFDNFVDKHYKKVLYVSLALFGISVFGRLYHNLEDKLNQITDNQKTECIEESTKSIEFNK